MSDEDLTPDPAHGIAATHPERETQAFVVAPTTENLFNVLSLDLVAVACLKLQDVLFEFDSSFPNTRVLTMLAQLPALRETHRNAKGEAPPLSIFGHADPVGNDDYNKQLSGRRAIAIYAVLTRDFTLWNFLFDNPSGGDNWQAHGFQELMRKEVGAAPGTPRATLSQSYMDRLCPFQLKKTDFLGKGADPKGKADFQGCSEFNPLVLLSESENNTLPHDQRNEENAVNRRVLIFLFRPGTKLNPSKWPCPTALAGTADCFKRFFGPPKTGNERRKTGPVRRTFADTGDTFGCRFYDRVSKLSPCESPSPVLFGVNPLIFFFGAPPTVAAPDAPVGAGAGSSSSLVSASTIGKVGLVQDIVLVKKSYTSPKRVPVVLKTDKPFDGNGLLTLNRKDKILFFATATSKTPLAFNGTDNLFKGAQLTPLGPGVSLFAEGLSASASMGDVVLTLKLSGGTLKPGPDAVGKMSAIELLLDICAPRVNATTAPVPLPQPPKTAAPPPKPADKFFLGRPVPIQDAPKIQERAMLMIQPVKTTGFRALNKKLVLVLKGTNVTTFTRETPDATTDVAVAVRHTLFSADTATTFFVEGKPTESATARDVEYQLGIDLLDDDGDRVKVTVLHAEIVSSKEPKDVHTVAIVPEKPPRPTRSTFFPAPIIVGRNFPCQLRPFVQLAVASAFKWSLGPGSAAILNLTDNAKEIVKATSTGQSTKQDDVMVQVLFTTDLGQFLRRHRLTVVRVTIDPVTSADSLTVTDDINAIKNPAGLAILSGAAAGDPKQVAKVEMLKFPAPGTLGIEPNLTWTDDDPRIAWWIIGEDSGLYKGKADFRNTENSKRGTKVEVFGVKEGDVLIQPYSGGFGYGMFRANVVTLRKLKYRANRIFINAKPAAPPAAPVIERKPTASHADIRKHIKVVNVYLRPTGIELIPDDSVQTASPTHNNLVGVQALDANVVAVTPVGAGHFDVEVNDSHLTHLAGNTDQNHAIQINARNGVITFGFIHSQPGVALASANLLPVNHAPQPRKDPPRPYTKASYTLPDSGVPSSSLIPKNGIPPNLPVGTVKMIVIPQIQVTFLGSTPATRDTRLLWGVIVPTTNIDTSGSVVAGNAASLILAYANTLAHEVAHVLGLGHRGVAGDPFSDGLTIPGNENMMHPSNPPPQAENFDIIQVKAIRFSEVLVRNP